MSQLNMQYLGLITGQFTYQGPSGPQTMTPHEGQGVPVYLVDPWTEEAHKVLPQVGKVAVLAPQDPTTQAVASLVGHLHQAFANDGRITLDEVPQLVRDLLATPDLQAVIDKSVGKWVGLVR